MSLEERIRLALQAVGARFKGLVGAPVARTVALGTAYQPSAPTRATWVTITLTSTASLSLTGGSTNTADIVMGPTAAIATTGGNAVGRYSNTNTGALTIGLALSTVATNSFTIAVPAGWYYAVRPVAGTVSVVSAFEQPLG